MRAPIISWLLVIGFVLLVYWINYMPIVGPDQQKKMVVIIPSYNNALWYKKNLSALFSQNYDNYRVIYLDDCSTDGTYDLVKQYVYDCGMQDRVTLISNECNYGPMYNIYQAVHQCENTDIIIDYDGDDWFAHANVLQMINAAYQDPHVWLTYGQYVFYPGGYPGMCKSMPQEYIDHNSFRKNEWFTSHLRTFYAGLFKQINKEDLQLNGEFYRAAGDLGFMFPLLEMAGEHIKFIPEYTYVYNWKNPIGEFRVHREKQILCENEIRNKTPYQQLLYTQAQELFLTS